MESSDLSRNRQSEHLGVNKIGKNIKKSPLHQPNFTNTAARQQPQPQVYNINKNDFRNIVQQLTGSPSHDPLPRPPNNQPKSPSMRLQRIRPPPLSAPVNRPQMPIHPPAPVHPPLRPEAGPPFGNNFGRPAQYGQQPSPTMDSVWANTAESPISQYMRYLQNSIIDSGPRQNYPHPHPQQQPQFPGQYQAQPHQPTPPLQSPRMNNGPPLLPSPRMNGPPPLLPSPTSQFLLPSPTGFLNLPSPRSPYPLLSPGYQFPPPLTPNFSFGQSGILGPGPPSPGIGFPPLSPSGFFPISSPRWRDH
ncbi:hypothetical protein LguiA_034000 [Lonicera macranthoides]